MTKAITLYPSTRRQAAATVYGDWVDASRYTELPMVLAVTAQGAYTDETLDVTLQGMTPLGGIYDIVSFTQAGNKTGALPFLELKGFTVFGKMVRVKVVTAGTAVDYTLSVSGWGKRPSAK